WALPSPAPAQAPGPKRSLFLRRQRPQVGDDGIEVGVGHLGVVLITHRALERRAVLPLALGDRGLDLGVGPVADAGGLVRGDVARLRDAPGAGEFAAALAERVRKIGPARRR